MMTSREKNQINVKMLEQQFWKTDVRQQVIKGMIGVRRSLSLVSI